MPAIGDVSKARFNSFVVDNIIGFILTVFVMALIPERFQTIRVISLCTVYLFYFTVFEALWSRTPGKYFQDLIIRKIDGSRCGWKEALIRSLSRIVEVNPLLLGAIPAGLFIIRTRLKQRLGDILAGTVVVSVNTKWD